MTCVRLPGGVDWRTVSGRVQVVDRGESLTSAGNLIADILDVGVIQLGQAGPQFANRFRRLKQELTKTWQRQKAKMKFSSLLGSENPNPRGGSCPLSPLSPCPLPPGDLAPDTQNTQSTLARCVVTSIRGPMFKCLF